MPPAHRGERAHVGLRSVSGRAASATVHEVPHPAVLLALDERRDEKEWSYCWFRVPTRLTRQMVTKGCVAVDGVSLTIVDVEAERFNVMLIPHTLAVTTLGGRRVGDAVNIETDLLAKYVQQQLGGLRGT